MRALHGNLATMETDLPLFCPSGGRCGRRHDYAARQRTVLRVIAKHLLERSISGRQTEALKGAVKIGVQLSLPLLFGEIIRPVFSNFYVWRRCILVAPRR